MPERRVWNGGNRPPRFRRPPEDKPLGPGTALGLWLDSIDVAASPFASEEASEFAAPPPLTPEEADAIAAYLSDRWPAYEPEPRGSDRKDS